MRPKFIEPIRKQRLLVERSILNAVIHECELVIDLFVNLSEYDFHDTHCRKAYAEIHTAFIENRFIDDGVVEETISKIKLSKDCNLSTDNNEQSCYNRGNVIDILSFISTRCTLKPRQIKKVFENYCRVISITKLAHKSRQLTVSINQSGNFEIKRQDPDST